MTTFAHPTFSYTSYATFRPSYSPRLYDTLLAYHQGPKKLCLDLGCGTGIVTRAMSKHFDRVIGLDPSAGMVQQAREGTSQTDFPNVEFRHGRAEDANGLFQDGEVDCVTAGTAAHWFDYSKIWTVLNRLVRKDGTLAFWCYINHTFVDFPRSTVMRRYEIEMHPDLLGPYWEQPQESYLQDKLRVVQPPSSDWDEVKRIDYDPGTNGKGSGEGTLFVQRSTSIGEFKAYCRTWSAYHRSQEAHPGRKARNQGGGGDVIDDMVGEIAKADPYLGEDENVVEIEWSSTLIMARGR